jgi:lipopolysaccharide export system permease protein
MDDNGEIIALLSSGFETSRIFKPVLLLTVILAIIAGLISFFIRPWSYQNVYLLEYHTKHTFDIAKINPGHFVSFDEDKRIIYTMDKTEDGLLKDVFIQTKNEDTFEITYAKNAKINDNGSNRVLVLKEGTINVYDLKTKKEAFSKFGTSYVNITTTASLDYKAKSQPTYKLLQNLTRENMIELQWRITVPIMTIFFGLLATALSRSSPRVKRRAQKLMLAILIYAVYYNFYQVFKKWVLNGYFPLIPGTFFLTALLFVIYIYIKLINKKEYLY